MNGWQTVCRQLKQLGVEHVFGLPGTQNAELFSELALTDIHIVPASSEKAAAFAAIGYAIGTGTPSVLLTIAGPGFCYTAAPLIEAAHDSVPLINIVIGDVEKPDRKFQLQAIDHVGLAARLTKATRRVRESDELLPSLEWAWQTAIGGEPGPVVVFVDNKTLNKQQDGGPLFELASNAITPPESQITELCNLVAGKRVMVLAGRGAAGARPAIERLVHKNNWPLMTTVSGRGILPENDPLVLRSDGCYVAAVNSIIEQMDVVLVIGAKLTHNGSFGFQLDLPTEKLVHVDASSEVLNANYEARLAICCDANLFCQSLAASFDEKGWMRPQLNPDDLQDILDASRPEQALEPRFEGEYATAAQFFATMQETMPEDTIFVTDSGYHQVLARRYLVAHSPNQIVVPSDFQSMGFGLPAAIGLALAQPDCTIVVIHGDGGFQMCAPDLSTAVQENLCILVCVLDDGFYGLIRMQQLSSGDAEAGVALPTIKYPELTSAFGAAYVSSLNELRDANPREGETRIPILLHQRIAESHARKTSYSRARKKGHIRRLLGPNLIGWIKKDRK